MTELMNNQRAVDIVTLAAELDRYKERDTIGGVAYLGNNLLDSTTVFCYSFDSGRRYEQRTKEPSGSHHILRQCRQLHCSPCGATLARRHCEMPDLRQRKG
ncbi:MAG: hypothetical protein ABR991_12495 [Terracidiphilus sp.]